MNKPRKLLLVMFVLLTAFLVFSYLFILPFLKYENNLAINLPNHIEEQMQKRHDTYIPANKISKYVKEAAVSSQDRHFYSNLGIDVLATFRAFYYILIFGQRQGASTITEQLAKNVYYQDRDNLRTDIETKLFALFITAHFSKDKILEMYLNEIYYGKNSYGINAAAAKYFKTTPNRLNIYQSAYLIALINAPSILSSNPEQANEETKNVLLEMLNNNYISKQEELGAEKFLLSF